MAWRLILFVLILGYCTETSKAQNGVCAGNDDVQVLPNCTFGDILEFTFPCLDILLNGYPYSNTSVCRSNLDDAIACVTLPASTCLTGSCSTKFEDLIPDYNQTLQLVGQYLSQINSLSDIWEALNITGSDLENVENLVNQFACPIDRKVPEILNEVFSQIPKIDAENYWCDHQILDSTIEFGVEFIRSFYRAKDQAQICEAFGRIKYQLVEIWTRRCGSTVAFLDIFSNLLPKGWSSYTHQINRTLQTLGRFYLNRPTPGCKDRVVCPQGTRINIEQKDKVSVFDSSSYSICPNNSTCAFYDFNKSVGSSLVAQVGNCLPQSQNPECPDVDFFNLFTDHICKSKQCNAETCQEFTIDPSKPIPCNISVLDGYGNDDCGFLATCTSTNNLTECQCNEGYYGDGKTCVDINECEAETANCPKETQCLNKNGTYFCVCEDIPPSTKCQDGISLSVTLENLVYVYQYSNLNSTESRQLISLLKTPLSSIFNLVEITGFGRGSFAQNNNPPAVGLPQFQLAPRSVLGQVISMTPGVESLVGAYISLSSNFLGMSGLGSVVMIFKVYSANSNFTAESLIQQFDDWQTNNPESNFFNGSPAIYTTGLCFETCHVNASCKLFGSSPLCVCNAGFTGNGTYCKEIKSCTNSSTDLQVLPACSLKEILKEGFKCLGPVLNGYPYNTTQTCRSNIDGAIACLVPVVSECFDGNCPSILDAIPGYNATIFQAVRFILADVTTLNQLINRIDMNNQTGPEVQEMINQFVCPTNRTIPLVIQQFFSSIEPLNLGEPICDNKIVDDLFSWAVQFIKRFYIAEDQADICEAIGTLKYQAIEAWNQRCSEKDLFHLIGNILPDEFSQYFSDLVKIPNILEDFFINFPVPGCNDLVVCPQGYRIYSVANKIPIFDNSTYSLCPPKSNCNFINITSVQDNNLVATQIGKCVQNSNENSCSDLKKTSNQNLNCTSTLCTKITCQEFTIPPRREGQCLVLKREVIVLPACGLRDVLDESYQCIYPLLNNYPYNNTISCRANIDLAITCLANKLNFCFDGNCSSILNLIPGIDEYLPIIRQAFTQVKSLDDLFRFIGNDSAQIEPYVDEFVCPTNRTLPDILMQSFMQIQAVNVGEPVCDNKIVDDAFQWLMQFLISFYQAEDSRDICEAMGRIKYQLIEAWNRRCNVTALYKLLDTTLPVELKFNTNTIKNAIAIGEDFVLNIPLPGCNGETVCPQGIRLNLLETKVSIFDNSSYSLCPRNTVCVFYNATFNDGNNTAIALQEGRCGLSGSSANCSDVTLPGKQLTCNTKQCSENTCQEFTISPAPTNYTYNVQGNCPDPNDVLLLLPSCPVDGALQNTYFCSFALLNGYPYKDYQRCSASLDNTISCLATVLNDCLQSDCPSFFDIIPGFQDNLLAIRQISGNIHSLSQILDVINLDNNTRLQIEETIYQFVCPLDNQIPALLNHLLNNISNIYIGEPVCDNQIVNDLIKWGTQFVTQFYQATESAEICEAFGKIKYQIIEAWNTRCNANGLHIILFEILPLQFKHYSWPIVNQLNSIGNFFRNLPVPGCFGNMVCPQGVRINRQDNRQSVFDNSTYAICPQNSSCEFYRYNSTNGENQVAEVGKCSTSSDLVCPDLMLGVTPICTLSKCNSNTCPEFTLPPNNQVPCTLYDDFNGTTGSDECNPMSTCILIEKDVSVCQCNEGYSGDGRTCTDINECVMDINVCGNGTQCLNNIGSFICTCEAENAINCLDGVEVALTLSGFEYTPELADLTSVQATSISVLILSILENIFGSVRITGFHRGSLVVSFDIFSEDPGFNYTIAEAVYDEAQKHFHYGILQPYTPGECFETCHFNGSCKTIESSTLCVCNDGYTGNGTYCEELKDCNDVPPVCSANAICTNTPGSYNCSCSLGYSGNGIYCEDINECKNSNSCNQNANCINTNGSYTCECNEGYTGNRTSCNDIDECLSNAHNCMENATCFNVPGYFDCQCSEGFTGNGVNCTAIKNCNTNPGLCHEQATCIESEGSYLCVCYDGFSGNGKICEDINECEEEKDNCQNATCVNNLGSYTCQCNDGYTGDRTCFDVNECEIENECSDNASCFNNEGSYTCECNEGYTGIGNNCTDVNECEIENKCSDDASCSNNKGSYTCECIEGYTGNGRNCTDVNECKRENDCSNNASCSNNEGFYTCECNEGYTGNGNNCTDVNECEIENDCSDNASCSNNDGFYTCACNEGYTGNGRNCTDVNECETENDCSDNSSCSNNEGSYTCECNEGYTGNGNNCTDVNECEIENDCPDNASCSNNKGSYTCECNEGYTGSGNNCTDVNECEIENDCSDNASCSNNEGSYTCECNEGYTGNGNSCTDVNECEIENDCSDNASCSNNEGSYTCECNKGYTGNGRICTVVETPCSPNPCENGGTCMQISGGYDCSCVGGYIGDNCEISDQCSVTTCGVNAYCTEKQNTAICKCNDFHRGNPNTRCERVCAEKMVTRENQTFTFPEVVGNRFSFSTEICENGRSISNILCTPKGFNLTSLQVVSCDTTIESLIEELGSNIGANTTSETLESFTSILQVVSTVENISRNEINTLAEQLNQIVEISDSVPITPTTCSNLLGVADRVTEGLTNLDNDQDTDGGTIRSQIVKNIDQLANRITLPEDTNEFGFESNNIIGRVIRRNTRTKRQTGTVDFTYNVTTTDQSGNMTTVELTLSIPSEVFNTAENDPNYNNLIALFYYTNSELFASKLNSTQLVSLTIGGVEINNLQNPVRITHQGVPYQLGKEEIANNQFMVQRTELSCQFWDFNLNDWSSEGCCLDHTTFPPVCQCSHLTNFALIVARSEVPADVALSLISDIGVILSIIGLVVTILLHLANKERRKLKSTNIFLNVVCNLLIAYVLFIAGIEQTGSQRICLTITGLLQFFFLSTWCWMAVYSYDLYMSLVKVFRDSVRNYLFKFYVFSYGVPLLIVIINIAVTVGYLDEQQTSMTCSGENPLATSTYRADNFCWLTGGSLYYAFLLPIGILLIGNIFCFVVVLRTVIFSDMKISSSAAKFTARQGASISATLISTMGITWIIAYFMLLSTDPTFLRIMSWLFAVFSGTQGFMIFIMTSVRFGDLKSMFGGVVRRVSISRDDINLPGRTGSYNVFDPSQQPTGETSFGVTKTVTSEIK